MRGETRSSITQYKSLVKKGHKICSIKLWNIGIRKGVLVFCKQTNKLPILGCMYFCSLAGGAAKKEDFVSNKVAASMEYTALPPQV